MLREIIKLRNNNNFKIIPSIRFEFYLSLLKNSDFIIGNSSSGVREAPALCVNSINLGNRQKNRAQSKYIKNIDFKSNLILKTIKLSRVRKKNNLRNNYLFGRGNSAKKFMKILNLKSFLEYKQRKHFSV